MNENLPTRVVHQLLFEQVKFHNEKVRNKYEHEYYKQGEKHGIKVILKTFLYTEFQPKMKTPPVMFQICLQRCTTLLFDLHFKL